MTQDNRVFLPKEVLEGLARARKQDRKVSGGKLRVQVGDDWYPIRSYDDDGFEIALDDAPKLRGLVEIHDGPRYVRSALIMAVEAVDGAMRYGFKRVTSVRNTPPVDYEISHEAPAGYLTAQ